MSNAELMARRNAALPRGVASLTSVFVAKAENSELWDVEGKRYVDFAAGIAVCNTGHRHPKIMAATARQSEAFVHTAFQINPYEIYVSLAERLNRLAPISEAKTIFLNSGAEAVENAVKIARHHTQRSSIIAFSGAFHGRSMLTMGLTGKAVPYKAGFGPMPAGIHHVPFPLEQYGVTIEDCLKALELLFKVDVPASQVAAIIIEPVQGEGGFQIARPVLPAQEKFLQLSILTLNPICWLLLNPWLGAILLLVSSARLRLWIRLNPAVWARLMAVIPSVAPPLTRFLTL